MIDYSNATLTDSLERELLSQEIDYYYDSPVQSLFSDAVSGIKSLVAKLASLGNAASSAKAEGQQAAA